MVKVRFRCRDMVKTKNVVPGSTKYVDLGTPLTLQNQDMRWDTLILVTEQLFKSSCMKPDDYSNTEKH